MAVTLDDVELRVLGVLIEKSLTQASTYPLTLNAIVLGANQKQNRDPVVEFDEAHIASAVYSLERYQLVTQAAPGHGARANRFAHNVVERLHWDRRAQAVMAELMLRGAQTSGELRSRASRMTSFADLPAVMVTLHELMACDPPFVRELPREPGKSANRFRHLLGGSAAAAPAEATQSPGRAEPAIDTSIAALADRLARLEAQVAHLSEIVERKTGGGEIAAGTANSASV